MDADATLQVEAFRLRFSSYASRESREAAVDQYAREQRWRQSGAGGESPDDIPGLRARVDSAFFQPLLEKQRRRWGNEVESASGEIGGVRVDEFVPKGGVSPANRARVLINLHGGGFQVGAGSLAAVESIPIAGLGKFRVVSVDYRMFPEHRFPAASEDVASVYEALLADYEPSDIGIYGGSAGGILTAEAMPWFREHGLPLPGAIGMFGATGQRFRGDSVSLQLAYTTGLNVTEADLEGDPDVWMPYFTGTDVNGPLASPMLWPEVLKEFPPSLLVTGTRAAEMSSMVDAHNKLTLAGARSRLHVWDGLGHCFYLDGDLPESHEAERIIVEFFDETLGPR